MTRDYFTRLYDYTFWADAKLWESVLQLTDEQYTRELDYSHGSIQAQCFHMLATMHLYFTLLRGERSRLADFASEAL